MAIKKRRMSSVLIKVACLVFLLSMGTAVRAAEDVDDIDDHIDVIDKGGDESVEVEKVESESIEKETTALESARHMGPIGGAGGPLEMISDPDFSRILFVIFITTVRKKKRPLLQGKT